MNIKIELRYSVLTALVILLWLVIEYAIGLQDTYIAFYPYVSLIMFVLPAFTYRLAIIEKLDKYNGITFTQVFFSCLLMTIFVSVLLVPVQLFFLKVINPDFFANMIAYAVQQSKKAPEQVAFFFNQNNFITETIISNFVISIPISLILAAWMRTKK